MRCPACQASNRDGAKFCHRCGYALSVSPDIRLRQLDLCFVMDATGSMRAHIEATRKNLQAFARRLTALPMRPDMAYALVLYRDHADAQKSFVTQCIPFSSYLADLQLAFDETRVQGGGGDGAEAVADGLYDACYRLRWRENAHKVILLAGDAPPHGKGAKHDSYPHGCPCGHVPETLAREAHERGITIFSLGIGDNAHMAQSFQQLASIGGGQFVFINSSETLIDQVLALLRSEVGKMGIDDMVYAAYRPGATPQSIAAATRLPVGEVDESMNRLRQKRLI